VLTALFVTGLSLSGAETWRLALPEAIISDANVAKVRAGSPVVEVLPARDRDLAVVGIVKVAIDSRRFLDWVRQVERLQQSTYIPLSRRFSNPPTIDDVRELALDDQDLDDLRECRPGDCGVKLSAPEIVEIRQVIAAAGAGWREAAQSAFRRLIVNRARAYLTEGHRGAAPYYDHKAPVSPGEEFEKLSESMDYALVTPAGMGTYLRSFPRVNGTGIESFLYWSKETLGSGKPIIAITHVSLFPPGTPGRAELLAANPTDAATVAFKQVYATHYTTASLSVTRLTPAVGSAPRYLAYTRRSRTDVLGGTLGGIIRRLIERRIRSEAPAALDGLRRRLETEPMRDTASS
jgi:hypothetical protein